MNPFAGELSASEDANLRAALHLEAVLPGMVELVRHNDSIRQAASGKKPLVVGMVVSGIGQRTLSIAADGTMEDLGDSDPPRGTLRLWHRSAGGFLRIMTGRIALVVPSGQWSSLRQLGRFKAAGRRFETLLLEPEHSPEHYCYGNLSVGLRALLSWIRHHRDGERIRKVFRHGVIRISGPGPVGSHWVDFGVMQRGTGDPPGPTLVEIAFHDLETLMGELNHHIDTLAAVHTGKVRITGFLPAAEQLTLLFDAVSARLKPAGVDPGKPPRAGYV